MNAQKDFLKELSELSRKYRIEICGCGCCSSPWLETMAEDETGPECCYLLHGQDACLMWVDEVKYAEAKRQVELMRQEHEQQQAKEDAEWDNKVIQIPEITPEEIGKAAQKFLAWKASLK